MFTDLLIEFKLSKTDLDLFLSLFVFFNKDGVLGVYAWESPWDVSHLVSFISNNVLVGFRDTENGDKTYLYLSPAFKSKLSQCVLSASREALDEA